MKKGNVVGTSSHSVDLSDGRAVAPGEVAEDVDIEDAHNAQLLLDGHLNVLTDTGRESSIQVPDPNEKDGGQS